MTQRTCRLPRGKIPKISRRTRAWLRLKDRMRCKSAPSYKKFNDEYKKWLQGEIDHLESLGIDRESIAS